VQQVRKGHPELLEPQDLKDPKGVPESLVRLDRRLHAEGLAARLILQVHDEVLVEAPPEEKERVESIILDALIHAAELSVTLEVSLAWGENWAAAKG